MSKRIKVKLAITVEVDAEDWDLTYGSGTSAAEMREDIKSYFLNAVQQAPCMDEVSGEAWMTK